MARKPFAPLYFVYQQQPFLDWKALLTVTQALFIPIWATVNELYMGLSLKKKHLETTVSIEYDSLGRDGHVLINSGDTAALITNWLLNAIQGINCHDHTWL